MHRAALEAAKAERIAVATKMRAIGEARRTATPLTGGASFGDLSRMEPRWHDAAQVLAGVPADLLWAADLDAPPLLLVWASEAATQPPPVILHCHELWTGLEYMPQLYQAGWHAPLADRFIPLAAAVLPAVSEPIARVLAGEHGELEADARDPRTMRCPGRHRRSGCGRRWAVLHIPLAGPHRSPGLRA